MRQVPSYINARTYNMSDGRERRRPKAHSRHNEGLMDLVSIEKSRNMRRSEEMLRHISCGGIFERVCAANFCERTYMDESATARKTIPNVLLILTSDDGVG